MEHDRFTPGWYSTFLDEIPKEHSAAEVALVARQMPSDEYPTLLDVACGPGRRASMLSAKGCTVVGIDNNAGAVEAAERKAIPRATFTVLDMRRVSQIGQTFDGALNLWHSFGYYDDTTNAGIIRGMYNTLREGGRVVFDIYNRDHMRTLPAVETSKRNGVAIVTHRSWQDDRMRCEIAYEDAPPDILEWKLFAPDEFADLAKENGFSTVLRCAWFDESLAPSAEHARMQFMFEKQ